MAGFEFNLSAGSITASYTIDNSGNPILNGTTISGTLTYNGLSIDVMHPVVMSLTADTGNLVWSDPSIWGGVYLTGFAIELSADVYNYVDAVFSGDIPGAFSSVEDIGDLLNNRGPTAIEFSISLLDSISFSSNGKTFTAPLSISVTFDFNFAVEIPNSTTMVLDQANVDIHSVAIDSGGALVLNEILHCDTTFTNQGTLDLGGQSVDVVGTFDNWGIVGATSTGGGIYGTVDNEKGAAIVSDGAEEIELGSGASADLNAGLLSAVHGGTIRIDNDLVNIGQLQASSGGSILIGSTLLNVNDTISIDSSRLRLINGAIRGGTVSAVNNGVVDLDAGGRLRDVILSGDGTQTIESIATYNQAGELQDVTLQSGVTATAVGNLAIEGSMQNAGTIAGRTGGQVIVDGPVTLSGGGRVTLAGWMIEGQSIGWGGQTYLAPNAAGPDELFNADNVIEGTGGALGAFFINETGGAIEADAQGASLDIVADRFGNVDVNRGLIEAVSGGTLAIHANLDNSAGVLKAASGGALQVSGTVADVGSSIAVDAGRLRIVNGAIRGGTVSAVNNGVVDLDAGGRLRDVILSGDGTQTIESIATYNESGELQDVTLQSGVTAKAVGNLALEGAIHNAGTIAGQTGGQVIVDGPVTLMGGGRLTLLGWMIEGQSIGFGGQSYLPANAAGQDELFNVDNVIAGMGGALGAFFLNEAGGTIEADTQGAILDIVADRFGNVDVNRGLMRAAAGGDLWIGANLDATAGTLEAITGGTLTISSTVDNAGNTITANGGTILVRSGTVEGGTVSAVNNGVVDLDAGGRLRDVILSGDGTQTIESVATYNGSGELQDVTLRVGVTAKAVGNLALEGAVHNEGTIAGQTGGQVIVDGPVTLMGGGRVTIAGWMIEGQSIGFGGQTYLPANAAGPDELFNVDNVIAGTGGALGTFFLNEAGGVIEADAQGASLYIAADRFNTIDVNQGLMVASAGGSLRIDASLENTAGILKAASGGILQIGGSVTGGRLMADGGSITDLAGADISGAKATILNNGSMRFVSTFNGDVSFAGAGALALQQTSLSGSISGFAIGDTIDLTSVGYRSSLVALYRAVASGGVVQIVDTASSNAVQATLNFQGAISGAIFSLGSDGGAGSDLTLVATPGVIPVALYLANQSILDEQAGPIAIADTAANVSANIDALNADPHTLSIALTDSGTPSLTLTVAQAMGDTHALGSITNADYAIAISDTAAHVVAQLDALAANARVASIALTDGGTPVLALTPAQASKDSAALAKISGAFAVSETGVAGADSFVVGPYNTTFTGDAVVDTIDFSKLAGGALINLPGGVADIAAAGQSFAYPAGVTPAYVDTLAGAFNIIGTNFGDRIFGAASTQSIFDGNGNNVIYGGGASQIVGGSGASTIVAQNVAGATTAINVGNGANVIVGDAASDTITLGSGANYVYAGSGANRILMGAGANNVYASTGVDDVVYAATSGANEIFGDGSTTLDFSAEKTGVVAYLIWNYVSHDGVGDYAGGIKSVIGTNFDDRIEGATTTQTVTDGNGANIIYGGGATQILAGAGDNTIIAQATGGSVSITAGGGDNIVLGDAANDTIRLGNGTNFVYSGAGNNTILFGTGTDRLYASSGVDDVVFAANSAGHLVYGDGATILDYSAETSGIVAYLDGAYIGHDGVGDYAAGIAKITGTNFGDRIYGASTTTTIVDGAGNDDIYSGAATSIAAGGGDNTIIVQTSALATVSAGDGNNFTEDFAGSANIAFGNGANTLLLGSGTYDLTLGSGVNHVETSGAATLHLGSGVANVYATNATLDYTKATSRLLIDLAANSVIDNGQQSYVTGVTKVIGSNNGDDIVAGSTDVTIVGGSGADMIFDGAAGKDVLTGGGGADEFVFGSDSKAAAGTLDTITDFVSGTDKLTLVAPNYGAPGAPATLFNLTSAADPLYASFVSTIGAYAFNEATHNLMFNDPAHGGPVNLVQLTGVTRLAASDILV